MKRMKSSLETWTVSELVEHKRENTLKPNWEYQRGAVWRKLQAQLLIDSVMRGYRIPLFYLREVEQGGGRALEIIDGQQRINSLYGFRIGRFIEDTEPYEEFPKLLNPADEKEQVHFPLSLRQRHMPWAGCKYKEMSSELKEEFGNHKIFVAIMECEEDIARHLFIRLQRGVSLSTQQKRDAWPGKFEELAADFGGKMEDPEGKPPHSFFREVMGLKPEKDKTGNTRKIAAQLLMLFLHRANRAPDAFLPINSSGIDTFYREQVGMNTESDEVKRFRKILDKLTVLFSGERPLKLHDAIHLILFADMLMEGFTQTWESRIVDAFRKFSENVSRASRSNNGDFGKYAIWAYKGASDAKTIRARHMIYVRRMLKFLGDEVQPTDRRRNFPPAVREAVFNRDDGKCGKCKKSVKWKDAHIHHIKEHSKGGTTTIGNAQLLHKWCHREDHIS